MGNGSKIIYYSKPDMYGRKFQCSKRTAAHLDRTFARLAKKAEKDGKKYTLQIIQPSFNTGVSASAGTHDYDAVFDVKIVGMTWAAAQKWLRQQGWAAWWRKPPTFSDHIHMVSLPDYMLEFVARVGIYVPGQVQDYYAKKDGLASHAPDATWHPKDIKATIFDYAAYEEALSLRQKATRLLRRITDAKTLLEKTRRALKRLQS